MSITFEIVTDKCAWKKIKPITINQAIEWVRPNNQTTKGVKTH